MSQTSTKSAVNGHAIGARLCWFGNKLIQFLGSETPGSQDRAIIVYCRVYFIPYLNFPFPHSLFFSLLSSYSISYFILALPISASVGDNTRARVRYFLRNNKSNVHFSNEKIITSLKWIAEKLKSIIIIIIIIIIMRNE